MKAIASNEGMQPAKVTYQIGTRLSFLKGKRLPQRECFSADRQPDRNTGKPAPINHHKRRRCFGREVMGLMTPSHWRLCDAGQQTAVQKHTRRRAKLTSLSPFQQMSFNNVAHRVLVQVSHHSLPQSHAAEAS
ncbi:hypothetical protein CMV_027753 [Castanea mollissima]|uniref:Uncharacterized protein n=1 Tax=Castanea mollissima TaxID=60419 RepID=A0A8J4QIX9_9ROSI|nr:hypothetical protein CMV_027753 [Castanea mollissima]